MTTVKRARGKPRIGKSLRKVASVSIDPALADYAIATWGGLSTAVDDLLRRHRDRTEKRSANRLADIQTAE